MSSFKAPGEGLDVGAAAGQELACCVVSGSGLRMFVICRICDDVLRRRRPKKREGFDF